MEQKIKIEGVGETIIVRKPGNKRVSMRILPDGLIRISAPWYVLTSEIEIFALKNIEWIKVQKEKFEVNKIVFSIGQQITTRFHSITIMNGNDNRLQAGRVKSSVVITIPKSLDCNEEPATSFIRKVITESLRREAKTYLPDRLSTLAKEHKFVFNKLFIKKLKSKWGSCSSNGNINLNLFLMMLPDHLIDYIILHELAHTVEHNHGKQFKQLVNSLVKDDVYALNQELKQYTHFLHY